MDPYDTHIITIPLYLLADWMELKNYAKPSVSHTAFNLQRSLDSWVSAAFACHCRTMAQNVHTSFPSANSRRSCPCVSFRVVWPVNSTATAYIYVKYSARCIWAYANFTFRQKNKWRIWNAANSNLVTYENFLFKIFLCVWDKVSPAFTTNLLTIFTGVVGMLHRCTFEREFVHCSKLAVGICKHLTCSKRLTPRIQL